MNSEQIEAGVRLILQGLGCDLRDQNFKDTPERVARSYKQIFYSPEKAWNDFEEEYSDVIVMRGHELYTLCPHHLLPVRMDVYLAYRPNGRVLGLSKLARVCHEVNKGPILQEAFTAGVVATLHSLTGAADIACRVVGTHGCMQMRGVKSHADTVTEKFTGLFEHNPVRFYWILNGGAHK